MVDWDHIADVVDEASALGDDDAALALIDARFAGDEESRQLARQTYLGRAAERDARARRPRDELIGREFDDFRLVERIGKGGMGVVYRAEQRGLGRLDERASRDVAVKVLPKADDADGRRLVERFRREVDNALGLVHPHIVRVLTSGETDEHLWFAMELVEGHDLHAEFELQRKVREGDSDVATLWPPFGSSEHVAAVVRHVADVALALDHAHSLQRPLVHRDVKPRNILLRGDGSAVLADFGLAKVLGEAGLTTHTSRIGTPSYMSPEQARAASIELTTRSDIYSLGVVLFEALSLELPVPDKDYASALSRIATGDIRRLDATNPKVPRDLVTICHKCLSLKPGDRYASAAELRVDLQRFLRHEAISARPPSLWKRIIRWVTKHPKVSVAAAVAIVVSGVTWWTFDRAATQARRTADLETIGSALDLDTWEGHEDVALRAIEIAEREHTDADLVAAALRVERRREDELTRLLGALDDIPGAQESSVELVDGGSAKLPVEPTGLIRRASRAATANVLYRNDVQLAAAINALVPRVRFLVRDGPQAEVHARERDPVHGRYGAARLLGTTPLDVALPVGHYRFVFWIDDERFAEIDEEIDLAPDDVVATIREGSPVTLIEIPAGTLRLDDDLQPACCRTILDREVEMPALLVGETVVSNGEYLAFIEATGWRPPRLWRDCSTGADLVGFPPFESPASRAAFERLPATGMSVEDMQAYAEWAGCRLPTHFELEYALRGPTPSDDVPVPANVFVPDERFIPPLDRLAHYLDSAAPARSDAHAHPPHGLHHAVGNVHETTSSPPIAALGGTLTTMNDARLMLGGAWSTASVEEGYRVNYHGFDGIGEQPASFDRGFRCVRSIDPLE